MKLKEVQKIVEAQLVWKTDCANLEVSSCHASDMGLCNIRKCADRMDLTSKVGKGA